MCFQWVQWNCQTFYTFNQTLHLSTILRILTIMLPLATLRVVEPQLVSLIQIFLIISPSFILYGNTAIEDWSYLNKTRSRQNLPSSAQLSSASIYPNTRPGLPTTSWQQQTKSGEIITTPPPKTKKSVKNRLIYLQIYVFFGLFKENFWDLSVNFFITTIPKVEEIAVTPPPHPKKRGKRDCKMHCRVKLRTTYSRC